MSRQQAIWELEYMKCNSRRSLKKYIRKHANTPGNRFVADARKRLGESVDIPEEGSGDEFFRDLKRAVGNRALYSIAGVAAVILLSLFGVSLVKEHIKESQNDKRQKEYLAQIATRQRQFEEQMALLEAHNKEWKRKIEEMKRRHASSTTSGTNGSRTVSSQSYYGYNAYNQTNTAYQYPTESYSGNSEVNNSWDSFYQESYSRMARLCESAYRSLTNLGATWNDGQSRYGTTGRDDVWVGQQKAQFRNMQHEMQNLRHEASTKGVNISPSPVESYTVY